LTALKLYLDACVLISLFTQDDWSQRGSTLLRQHAGEVCVSDFVSLEVASAISRLVRMKLMEKVKAHVAFSRFDLWVARAATHTETMPTDITAAKAALRRLDLPLRSGDALNIVIANRIGASLATFDEKMAEAARVLGLTVIGDTQSAG
jgi:predicted nucleic acid-binding protein